MSDERRKCPDDGTCHHGCLVGCWRVQTCCPLSGVFPDDEWPPGVLAANEVVTLDGTDPTPAIVAIADAL